MVGVNDSGFVGHEVVFELVDLEAEGFLLLLGFFEFLVSLIEAVRELINFIIALVDLKLSVSQRFFQVIDLTSYLKVILSKQLHFRMFFMGEFSQVSHVLLKSEDLQLGLLFILPELSVGSFFLVDEFTDVARF